LSRPSVDPLNLDEVATVNWFFFALAGTAIFGLVALTDKYMLSSHFPDALVYAWVTGLAGGGSASLGIVVLGGAGIVQMPKTMAMDLLAPGALLFLAGFAYMRAMSRGVATVVVAYSQFTPVFAFGLGFWVLSEHLSVTQVLGMLLVIGSAAGLTVGSGLPAPGPDGDMARRTWMILGTALPLMMLSSVLRASSDLLMKQHTVDEGVLTAYLVSRQGILLCALLMLFSGRLRRRIWHGLTSTTSGSWVSLAFVEVGAISSFLLLTIALNGGPLALVSVISSNVAVFTFIYAVVFGRLLKVPNVPVIGIRWQRLIACLAVMAVGTAALSSFF